MSTFEELVEGTVRDMANPEPPVNFESRLSAVLWAAREVHVAKGATVSLLADELRAPGLLASLWSSVRELVWPQKLVPLVLESRSVVTVDPLAPERSSRSMLGAVLAHAVVILVIGLVVEARTGVVRTPPAPVEVVALEAPPLKTPPRSTAAGGGGGQRGPVPVTKGHLPKFAEMQIVPPKTPPLDAPKIAVEPMVEVQMDLKMAVAAVPELGIPNSPLIGRSMGNGDGLGLGSGEGNGIGPGSRGNTGGGFRHVGGSVSEPKVIIQPEAEYSDEARKAKFSGNVLVYLWVDEHGNPTHVRIARSVGLGLDEKAIEAVQQYKFRPATENGRPVTVEMYVDVNFHIL
ncbi:energy transducer TonB [Granulicella arctica]|uniref:energy transducer TonB n=1 Tax=Granulicella arctica TaxID=940613 RepID=UPI0021DF7968|nr:energy transducer TonB [Granulicella arctica]